MKEVAIIFIVFSIVCNVWIICTSVSHSSLEFVAFVLDNYRTCQASNGFSFQHGVVVKADQRMPTSDKPCTPEEHTVDDVIIWDPLTAFSNLALWCPFCAECSGLNRPLKATRWKDGKTTCDQPRRLYGLTNTALLVSRVYVCDQRHQVIAHDPAVLFQVQGVFFIPFLLFHKVGITRELHGFILSHANAGLTISEIQTLWLQTMYDAYPLRRAAHLSACTANSKLCTSYPEFKQNFQNPGEKVIASCIAGDYLKKEHLYTKRMCQMTAEKWLSCDHTFKVSANIGFWLNKRWVKLYDTLFIVLNEEGIVLSWKLCKGTKFLSVENVLKLLKERLDRQGKNPTIFMLDNCCSWRTKVTKVFPNIAVKLDPFHAIQRVIKKIPKKKGCTETITQLRRQMILSLKKIFREPADKGEQRTMDTPPPEIILKNIDNFMRQWKTVEFNSIPLLPSSAVHEIEKLKGHVTKGCLSGIPPSGGTNRNEALHRTLNKSLKRSRIGLELALAFLGLFFYKWNETKSKSNKRGQRISYIRPVESYISTSADLLSENKEQFGGSLNTQELEEAAGCELSDYVCDANQVLDCINSLMAEHSDNSDDNSFSSDDQDNNESDEEECGDSFNRVQIANVIQQALNFSCLSNHLKEIKGANSSLSRSASHLVNLKNILCLFSSIESNSAKPSEGDLDELLASNNLQRVKVPADGNCFFVSLAIMIKQQLKKGILTAEGRTRLQQLGVIQGEKFEINHIASSLRHVIVNEWLSNPSSYEPFLTSGQDYKKEANLFLQDGHFASELGNSMPLAASNALCLPIVVFTAMLNFPLLPICPQDKTVSDDPIYLVYDMSFAGHYDAVQQQVNQLDQQHQDEQMMTSTNQSNNQPQLSCRCGQGAKRKCKESITCHEYKTGCKCFQNVSGCSMYCQCINCNNPYGKNVSGSEQIPCSSRKRRHHENSTVGLKGKYFTEIKAGGTVAVQWTMFEELVLVELIIGLLARDKLEPEGLFREYNYIVDTVRPTNMGQYLGKKTEKQVTRKLSTFLNSQKVFETLMKEQTRINFGDS